MGKRIFQSYKSHRGWKIYIKSVRRREKFRLRKAGYLRYQLHMKRYAEAHGVVFDRPKKTPFYHEKKLPPVPDYSKNINFLLAAKNLFSEVQVHNLSDGHLYIPCCFSLIENYEESFNFLKRLFYILHKRRCDQIILDYEKCERIDVDASICMDIILADFIGHFYRCRFLGYKDRFPRGILPINFEKENIKKVLFSIGAYANLKGFRIEYPDILDLPVLINKHDNPQVWGKSEVDLTKIVEYIKRCLKRLNRELTTDAENEFYKVIGEVMSNALEHGTLDQSYEIGYFQEIHNEAEHYGIFNFSILNFGDTIYQTFKKETCPNTSVVKQMTDLSEGYTKKGWFRKARFEEETLWTLYALQEGVTSKEKKRGNGSIQYIENFFKLKGDLMKDNISRMVVVSGNTRILFDGTYQIREIPKEGEKRRSKVITFNESGEINVAPDENFVTFAPHFFPGTMISARILIKFDNTNDNSNGSQGL